MIKLKELINETLQLPSGKKIQMGKIFTGQGKAFVKEEDLSEAKEIKKSDVTKLVKMAKKIDKELNTLTKFYKSKIYNVNNSVVYKTWLSLDNARREYSIKAMSGIEYLEDQGWE
jgi:hypothetical protein